MVLPKAKLVLCLKFNLKFQTCKNTDILTSDINQIDGFSKGAQPWIK